MGSRWLSLKSAAPDALLTDNTQSLFGDVGYDRVANFIRERKDVKPDDNEYVPTAGGTKSFTIGQWAPLLGPTDLCVDLNAWEPYQSDGTSSTYTTRTQRWHNRVGFAMIKNITISVSNNKIQTIPGDYLDLKNALMTKDEFRLTSAIGEFGDDLSLTAWNGSNKWTTAGDSPYFTTYRDAANKYDDYRGTYSSVERRACRVATHEEGKTRLYVPLELFFTTHPSRFLKLQAVDNNTIRIDVEFRPLRDYLQYFDTTGDVNHDTLSGVQQTQNDGPKQANGSDTCFLRCHLYHVPRAEADQFKGADNAHLVKMIQHIPEKRFSAIASTAGSPQTTTANIQFTARGSVPELLFVVRRVKDLSRRTEPRGNDRYGSSTVVQGAIGDYGCIDRFNYLPIKRWRVMYDNDEREPWIDAHYWLNREVPMHHSQGLINDNIFGFSFSANPEGENPAGYDQLDKVKQAELQVELEHPENETLQVDMFLVTYNFVEYDEGVMTLSYNY